MESRVCTSLRFEHMSRRAELTRVESVHHGDVLRAYHKLMNQSFYSLLMITRQWHRTCLGCAMVSGTVRNV